jgi:hypothetical protein
MYYTYKLYYILYYVLCISDPWIYLKPHEHEHISKIGARRARSLGGARHRCVVCLPPACSSLRLRSVRYNIFNTSMYRKIGICTCTMYIVYMTGGGARTLHNHRARTAHSTVTSQSSQSGCTQLAAYSSTHVKLTITHSAQAPWFLLLSTGQSHPVSGPGTAPAAVAVSAAAAPLRSGRT